MNDSIKIYTMIRKWEDLRTRLIENMKIKQTSNGESSSLTAESEQKLKDELSRIASSFMQESTDVEFIVTHSFPELKKAAWVGNVYVEENKIYFQGYEYYLYKDVIDEDHLLSKFHSFEEAVREALRLTNSSLEISDAVNKFYL